MSVNDFLNKLEARFADIIADLLLKKKMTFLFRYSEENVFKIINNAAEIPKIPTWSWLEKFWSPKKLITDSVLPVNLFELMDATVTEPINPKKATPTRSRKDKTIWTRDTINNLIRSVLLTILNIEKYSLRLNLDVFYGGMYQMPLAKHLL